MSAPDDRSETFLQRWSRRKQAAETPAPGAAPAEPAKIDAAPPPELPSPRQSEPFDPTTLPPLESITSASDVRAFLAPGVPEELARAALRRAWIADPAIRNFIGLAENQWDFTKPDGVPGFGSLELTPELRRLAARLVGAAPPEAASRSDIEDRGQVTHQFAETPSGATQDQSAESDASAAREPPAAEQQRPGKSSAGLRRHGGAIPK